ncbi:MAG TPA: hypothetical protein VFV87_00265 [Pirellulaceae bacterium]|nr:hypothetical protein [Pirellulaceae bacterium]
MPCPCGRVVKVPRLSELRRQAGQAAFQVSAIDRIRSMLQSRCEAPGRECALSGIVTSDVMMFTVVCEKPYSTGYSWWWLFVIGLWSLPLSIFGYIIATRESGEAQGRELTVTVPLRIAAHCQADVRKFSPLQLANLLYTVPLYAALLDEYPYAEVSVGQIAGRR